MNYLTTDQAAQEMGVSVRAVQQLIKRGRLKAERFGNALAIRPADLAPFLNPLPRGRPRKDSPKKSEKG